MLCCVACRSGLTFQYGAKALLVEAMTELITWHWLAFTDSKMSSYLVIPHPVCILSLPFTFFPAFPLYCRFGLTTSSSFIHFPHNNSIITRLNPTFTVYLRRSRIDVSINEAQGRGAVGFNCRLHQKDRRNPARENRSGTKKFFPLAERKARALSSRWLFLWCYRARSIPWHKNQG